MINWFRRRQNEDRFEVVTTDVPMSTICRWYLYDTELTDNINKLAEKLGLNPISEEGEAKEIEDSEVRIKRMSPLFPYLDAISDFSASAISSLHTQEVLDSIDEEEKEEFMETLDNMHTIYKAVALSTLLGAFSVGLELGIINHDTLNSRTMNTGDDYE